MTEIIYRNMKVEKCLGVSVTQDGKMYKIIKRNKKTLIETTVEINPKSIYQIR